ncbi:vesicle transport through interaction with t-SNAREs homolog 1B-like [Canis lupus familiaris]|uniref:vesicle transport through interaction with t-SNAREs homolog 1B-like n=1 Tax=Canis lupus familiaris TaxID=9615 RepID=UPI0018F7D5C1|nr:vesicle transport through interaction with t-SNAREs homolog 1B-like [Canis lupus familiaris]
MPRGWAGDRRNRGGPGPQISAAAAPVQPAPRPPPPSPRSISRNFTRSSAASMKTCEGCRSGSWGWQKQLIRDFDKKQQEANATLAEMEEELRYAPLSFRNPMMSKLRTDWKDLAKPHREVSSTPLTATPGGRGDMKYGSYAVENEHMTRLQSQRALLLQGTDSLNRATRSIERSHRIATETDQIGSEIIEELGEQCDQLERTKSRLVNTSDNLSKSRKILRSMSRKVTTNKQLLSIVILLELAILGGLVYYKFFHKH